jgi:hypothetical protein
MNLNPRNVINVSSVIERKKLDRGGTAAHDIARDVPSASSGASTVFPHLCWVFRARDDHDV